MKNKVKLLILLFIQLKLFSFNEKDIKVYLIGIKEDNVFGLPVVSCLERNNYRMYYQIESDKMDKQLIVNINNILKKSYYMLNINPSRSTFKGIRYPFADFESIDNGSYGPPYDECDSLIKIEENHYIYQGMPLYRPSSFPLIDSLVNASKTNCFYKSEPLCYNQWEFVWKDNPLIQNAYYQQNYDIYDTSNADKFKHLICIVNDSVLFISAKEIMLINLKTGKPIHLLQELQQSKISEYYSFIAKRLFYKGIPSEGEMSFNHIDMFPQFLLGKVHDSNKGIANKTKWTGYFFFKSDRMDLYGTDFMHETCIYQIELSEMKKFLNLKSIYFDIVKFYILSKQKK